MQCRSIDAYAAGAIRFKAGQLVGKAGFTESDREDLKQELALDLLRRSRKYDPKRAKRSTFTSCVVKHRVASILAERMAPTRDIRKEGPSLNEMITDGEGNQVERIMTIDAQVNRRGRSPEEQHLLALDVQSLLETFPRKLRRLAERLKTETISEIARRAGVSRKQIYLSVWKIRRRFEKAGLRAYLS